jgi:biotin transporter BioY
MILIVPAIFMGHYIDELVEKMNIKDKTMSVTLQTFVNVLVIYILHKVWLSYTKEFQVSLAGLFFSALFFGMQTNYIRDIKGLLPQL